MSRARAAWVGVLVGVALLAVVSSPAAANKGRGSEESTPLVIGHRGAPGYLPDHTLQGYALAIKLGADYVEPDLVSTKDGHLIARHEPNIMMTTDVRNHPEFASRRRTAIVDGAPENGFFASDFTLAEIKTLRAVQPFPERPQQFNGRFEIPTLEEVIALVKRESRKRHRTIGIYPETKHPTYHKELGLPLEGRLVAALRRAGWNRRSAPVFIQSFEQSNLKQLNRMTRVRLVQLVDAFDLNPDGTLAYEPPLDRPYDWTVSGDPELESRTFAFFATDEGLQEVSKYADGIGPWKRYIVSATGTGSDSNRTLLPPTDLIQRAHAHGLLVHTWTFRNEQFRLVSDYAGNPVNEYLQFYRLGIDGVFSDFADTAVVARELFRLEQGGEVD
ncbi:MAG TPA: glycerophosphodiester phosphodiesterase [Thermoleophilaceae bacterium]|jgi:glycerophosphoryl diester phosphodiesterase